MCRRLLWQLPALESCRRQQQELSLSWRRTSVTATQTAPLPVLHGACIAVPYCKAAHLTVISAKLLLPGLVLMYRSCLLQARAASAKAKGEKVSKARKERTKEAKEVSASHFDV